MSSALGSLLKQDEMPDPIKKPDEFKSWLIRGLVGILGLVMGGFINDYKENRESIQALQVNFATMTETMKNITITNEKSLEMSKANLNATQDLKARIDVMQSREVGTKRRKQISGEEP